MKFQILDADYTYDNTLNPVIRLYGRDETGQSVCCFVPGFKPYFYSEPDNPHKANKLADQIKDNFREHVTDVEITRRFQPVGYSKEPETMLKIILKDPKSVPAIRDEIRNMEGISDIYETDILFRNRFLIDSGIGGMSWVKTDSQPLDMDKSGGIKLSDVDAGIKIISDTVTPVDVITNSPFRYMAFDIECLPVNGGMPVPELAPIIMISCAFKPDYDGYKTKILLSKEAEGLDKDVQTFPDEARMLDGFFDIIKEYDPDVLVGYNSNSFDIPYIIDRIKTLESVHRITISPVMGKDGRPAYYKKIGNMTRISITGRITMDVLPIIRREFSLKQYTLKNTAQELLSMEKLDVSPADMEQYWNDSGEKLRLFVDYARRDSELAMDLLHKLNLLDKFIALSSVSGTLIQDILDGGQTNMIENILLKEYYFHERVMSPKPDNVLSQQRHIKSEQLKGGEVLEPEKGLLEDVVILDYKSLYPTIMMAHNLCYTTQIIDNNISKENIVLTPSGGRFVSSQVQRGIVPAILEDLLNRRVETKQKMKEASGEEARVLNATQQALKILLNSFYGYSGYTRARLYSLTLANSVTSYGRENILKTKQVVEATIGSIYIYNGLAYLKHELIEAGMHRKKDTIKRIDLSVVYGDTDSVFVKLSPEGVSLDDAGVIGQKISRIVSATLPDPMELEFESFARRSIFIAKKRYALWVFEPGGRGWSDSIKVKGMETIRRDWCELTSKTLTRVLELVLKEGRVDDAIHHVRDVINSIRNIDLKADPSAINDLILTRKYTKKTESYRNRQPHITVVEKMKKRSGYVPSVGDRIPFVITNSSGIFVEQAEDPEYVIEKNIPLNVDYYIKKQILPPVDRILKELGVDVAVLDYDEKQKGLMDFGGGIEMDHISNYQKKIKQIKKNNQSQLFDF
jgi:DNA polymerase I